MQNHERDASETTRHVWHAILRGIALAHIWAAYQRYGGTSLSIGISVLALAVLEVGRSVEALRRAVGRGRNDGL